jgi:cyclophilin family peptidyl-prolyl cis-trans isomerase
MSYKFGFLVLCFLMLMILPVQARYFARWHTTMGNFTAELRDELAPITVINFVNLTTDHFYDGLHFHRVIANFMIQDGDPLGTGYGGPNYTIADEFNVGLYHDVPGMLAMANTGQPHSGGSQYYITVAPYPSGNGHYSIFGKVIEGMDVVYAISEVPTDAQDRPITPVYINTLEILGLYINSITPADSIVDYDLQTPYQFIMEGADFNYDPTFQWYINNELQTEMGSIFTPSFPALGTYDVKCIIADPEIAFTYTWHVTVSGVANNDQAAVGANLIVSPNHPNPFNGKTSISYQTKSNEPVQINVYDIRGRLLAHEKVQPTQGLNHWSWDAKNAASGIYLFEFKSGKECEVVKGININ